MLTYQRGMMMLSKVFSILIVPFILMLIPYGAVGEELCIAWAGSVQPGEIPPLNPENALGAPDANQTSFSAVDAEATYGSFSAPAQFPSYEFSDFLGISENDLEQADFIAFEGNQINGIGFESSTWTFSSGGAIEVFHIPDEAFLSGIITNEDYSAYFSVEAPLWSEWPFILVDLQTVDPEAADFTVTIKGEGTTTGSPEPDALGVLLFGPVPVHECSWVAVKLLYTGIEPMQ